MVCPDLVCVVDAETCEGLSNFTRGEGYKGKGVVVFGISAIEQWRTPRGIEIFGPKHFGFDIEFRPIEDVMEK